MTQDEIQVQINHAVQERIGFMSFKMDAKNKSLDIAPRSRVDAAGKNLPCTAEEMIQSAEILYRWLVKDLEYAPEVHCD